MNKIILAGAPLLILALAAPHAFAHQSNSERFDNGWMAGENSAAADYNVGVQYQSADTNCYGHHTKAFCAGYSGGYADEWSRSVQQNGNTVQTQGAEQNTNIHGDNNRVTNVINQGQASNSDGGSGHGSGQPRCVILCANVNVH